jgi:hypothetical protein
MCDDGPAIVGSDLLSLYASTASHLRNIDDWESKIEIIVDESCCRAIGTVLSSRQIALSNALLEPRKKSGSGGGVDRTFKVGLRGSRSCASVFSSLRKQIPLQNFHNRVRGRLEQILLRRAFPVPGYQVAVVRCGKLS